MESLLDLDGDSCPTGEDSLQFSSMSMSISVSHVALSGIL